MDSRANYVIGQYAYKGIASKITTYNINVWKNGMEYIVIALIEDKKPLLPQYKL